LTNASDFPVRPDAFQFTRLGGQDAFVTVVDWDDAALIFSTYLGGSDLEGNPSDIALDKKGDAYVAGWTWSHDFPTTAGAFQPSHHGGEADAFVVKIEHDRRKHRRR